MNTATLSTDPSSDINQDPIGSKDEGSPGDVIPEGGGDHPSSLSPPTPQPLMDDGSGIVSSEDMLKRCRERLKDRPTELWGSNVRASTVTLLVGETSAGKTVFLHNLAYHLASGQEFLGFKPHRPLRVLSVDFESNDEIRVTHLSTIGYAPGWDFYDQTQDLYALQPDKRGRILVRRLATVLLTHPYDILIVDPLVEAYPVDDENSNPEANQQMEAFRHLARSTQAGVILVHNAGLKGADPGHEKATYKGLARGASARVDRADIALNFTVASATERRLTVVKSRFGNLSEQITVRFSDELGYTLVESSAVSQSVVDQLCLDSVRVVQEESAQGQTEVTRKTIMERLTIKDGSARSQALDRVLSKSVSNGQLHKPRKGVYSLPPPPLGEESEAT